MMSDLITNSENGATLCIVSLESLRQIMNDCFLLCQAENDRIKTTNEDRLLTVAEVAKRLHVDRSTLWRWNKTKYLCPVKVGNKNMYRLLDIKSIEK